LFFANFNAEHALIKNEDNMSFKDHFSNKSRTYASARPTYPPTLYEFLSQVAPFHSHAWDCATGNGQAAIGLAEYFDNISATDASAQQIAHAIPHPKVSYQVALAEKSGLHDRSVDLVTVGTALHWFDLEKFYQEVDRVLKPRGVLAAFGYGFIEAPPEIAEILNTFAGETMLDFWPPEAILNWKDRYQSFPFPYPELDAPQFKISLQWHIQQLKDFVSSWSSVTRYQEKHGRDPTHDFFEELERRWGPPGSVRTIIWPLHMRIGRKTVARH
jgi:ubiquinone/menaquinone biosynthesis C-methylase UbiE